MITQYQNGDLVQMIRNTKNHKQPHMTIVHGCNCQKAMGAGIAGALREFPEVYEADKNSRPVLGTYSVASINSYSLTRDIRAHVVNAYTQEWFGTEKRHLNYAAVGQVFLRINDIWKWDTLYIPRIGAGLAGGNWDFIQTIINDATPDVNIIVIDYAEGVDPRES